MDPVRWVKERREEGQRWFFGSTTWLAHSITRKNNIVDIVSTVDLLDVDLSAWRTLLEEVTGGDGHVLTVPGYACGGVKCIRYQSNHDPRHRNRVTLALTFEIPEEMNAGCQLAIDQAIGCGDHVHAVSEREPLFGVVDMIAEKPVRAGQFVTTADVRPAPDPHTIRAENRRIGEEIASNPPEWAYPLAWRLAWSSIVEEFNVQTIPIPIAYVEPERLSRAMHVYHCARLDGLLPKEAERTAMQAGQVSMAAFACAAYERGRPGPGGCKVGRPA